MGEKRQIHFALTSLKRFICDTKSGKGKGAKSGNGEGMPEQTLL